MNYILDYAIDLLRESFPGFARKRFTPSKRHSGKRSIALKFDIA